MNGRLRRAWEASASEHPSPTLPFIRGAVASALHNLALFTGDAGAERTWSARRGCVKAATVVGPIDWTPLRGLEDPSPIAADQPLAKSYAGIPPFGAQVAPVVVGADACQLDVASTSVLQGTRAVVVDLTVPRPETISVSLTSSSAAVLDVGGARAIRRGFEAGGQAVLRFARVTIPAAGTVRVVARVAQRGDTGPIEIDALGRGRRDAGLERARARVRRDGARQERPGGGDHAAARPGGRGGRRRGAARDGGRARRRAPPGARSRWGRKRPQTPGSCGALRREPGEAAVRSPAMDLLYARAIDSAEDMPDNKASDRIRAAMERALAAWPSAWEARIGHARIIERRRGAGEGITEALRSLGAAPGTAFKPSDAMVAAYVAVIAKRSQLLDVAEAAYDAVNRLAPGSPLLAYVDGRLHTRTGADAVQAACQGGLRRSETDCFEALRDRGDFGGALADLGRLRALRESPDAYQDAEISVRILSNDVKGALAVYDSMEPGSRRMLEALGLAGSFAPGEARGRLVRDRITSRDSPYSIPTLVRALGVEPDPAPRLEEEGRRLVLADQRSTFLPGAGTAVLRHIERYGIEASGLVHFVEYDLRRVSGTTDVAEGAIAYGPSIEGRSAPRLLRKRIHKRDGRILEPDPAANASQASDLSQLEQGDYVEQIAEGWALPGDTGQIIIDTPDLLPERTSVREAVIEVRRAEGVPFSVWAHPLLGAPEEHSEGGYKVSVWRLRDQAPRRMEDGVPRMERGVSVSLGTQTWAEVGRAFQEAIRSLEDKDPYVVRWAEEVAGPDRRPSKSLVARVVAAAGKKIKVAGGAELSDIAAMYGGGSQHATARTILELGQGSRSWVIYRALRQLGVDAGIAIAEVEPWSAVASYPPHVGRFRHPLVVAHLGAEGDLWIDADVDGPPLPPGRISPELRGRTALLSDGSTITVQGTAGEVGDEADVRLTLDDKGDARGTFTVLLHGRTAQSLADAFETVVGSERREMLRRVVLGWLPWADVDEVALSSAEGSWEVALRATIAIHGFGRPEGKNGKTWVLAGLEPVHRGGAGTLGASYASRAARQNALAIDNPIQYHFHRRIELPRRGHRHARPRRGRRRRPQRLRAPLGDADGPDARGGLHAQPAHRDGPRRAVPGLRREGAGHRRRLHGGDAHPREVSADMREGVPLGPLTTLGVGGPARFFASVASHVDAAEAAAFAEAQGLPTLVLGGGSNLLVADRGFHGVVLRVRVRGVAVREHGDVVEVEAGAGMRVGRSRGARRGARLGRHRVPLRHTRRGGRDADTERRRLRAGGGRDHPAGARRSTA